MCAMRTYSVYGPYQIPVEKKPVGRRIGEIRGIWEGLPLRGGCGCYVYGMSTGGGPTPLYVGKATRRFEEECFTPHKMDKYNEGLAMYVKGLPVMYFVVQPPHKGRVNKKEIKDVEHFLIQLGVAKNPDLLNIRGVKQPQWSISSVVRGQQGRPSEAGKEFAKMMGTID